MAGVVHFEIPTENKERANTFYQTAFNWNLVPMQGMDYTSAITIDVEDVDAALAQVESAGGSVAQAKDAVPGMGYYAYFTDTEGNVLGLWQTDSSAGS